MGAAERQQRKAAVGASHEGEHSGDINHGAPVPISSRTQMMTVFAAGNSLLLGYDIGISSLVSQDVSAYFDLDDTNRGLFVGSINLLMIVGALASPSINDRFGRRACFCVSASIIIAGLVLLISAESYTQLMGGRCIVVIGAGVGLAVTASASASAFKAKCTHLLLVWPVLSFFRVLQTPQYHSVFQFQRLMCSTSQKYQHQLIEGSLSQ